MTELFDAQLPNVGDIPPEPDPEPGWQKLRIVGAKAEMLFASAAKGYAGRPGLNLVVAAANQPGTKRIFASVVVPTAEEIHRKDDPTAAAAEGATEKEIQGARLTCTKYNHFLERTGLEDAKTGSLTALAVAAFNVTFDSAISYRKGKDRDGNPKQYLDVDFLRSKPVNLSVREVELSA